MEAAQFMSLKLPCRIEHQTLKATESASHAALQHLKRLFGICVLVADQYPGADLLCRCLGSRKLRFDVSMS